MEETQSLIPLLAPSLCVEKMEKKREIRIIYTHIHKSSYKWLFNSWFISFLLLVLFVMDNLPLYNG